LTKSSVFVERAVFNPLVFDIQPGFIEQLKYFFAGYQIQPGFTEQLNQKFRCIWLD
jgi:hypothetical protein